jgi:hypothetical protein
VRFPANRRPLPESIGLDREQRSAVVVCQPTSGVFSYLAYGLCVHAAMPLPELAAGDAKGEGREAKGEVSIRFGCVDHPLLKNPDESYAHLRHAPQEDYLFWQEVGSFLVQGGHTIIVDPSRELDETTLRLFLLGPVMSVLLSQRGHLVLHASAVAVDDGAILFLGNRGWGKSTMAAALHARGHALVTDDVAVLGNEESYPMVFPAFPQLKLWPKTLVSLGEDPEKLPQIHARLKKRARPVEHNFSPASLPLKRIYVLGKGKAPEILPLPRQDALAELVRHTWGSLDVGSSAHFLKCASIVGKVTICRLRRQKSLSQLPEVAQLIEEDVTRDTEHAVLGEG